MTEYLVESAGPAMWLDEEQLKQRRIADTSWNNDPLAARDEFGIWSLVEGAGKTKKVAGEDLSSSAFAYVGDADDPSTWKLPIKFSTDAKSASHVRNALARFGQTQGIPSDKKPGVLAKLKSAAKKHGIDVSEAFVDDGSEVV